MHLILHTCVVMQIMQSCVPLAKFALNNHCTGHVTLTNQIFYLCHMTAVIIHSKV